MNRNDILKTAELIVNGEREGQYGAPEDSFNNIARLWGIYLGCDLKPSDVANLMVLMKVARNMNGVYKADNWVDMAGYSALGGELQTLEEQKTSTSRLHYVKVPSNHIVIDFDIKNSDGTKSYEKNLEAESKWPKSAAGIHLHYLRNVNDANMFKEDK